MTDIRDAVEETCAGALSGGPSEDSVFERPWFQTAAGQDLSASGALQERCAAR